LVQTGGLLLWILARYAGHTVYAVLVDIQYLSMGIYSEPGDIWLHFQWYSSAMLGIGQAKCSFT
jgi:hypothetical protein